jgi:hypothetical protein
MAINIICPGCHSRFTVSEQHGGKAAPCPKCKTIINIPKASEEVKIHAPEDYGGAKGVTGELVLKPIARQETKLKAIWVAAIGAATIVTIGLAFIIGKAYPPVAVDEAGIAAPDTTGREQPPSPQSPDSPDQGQVMKSTVPAYILGAGALVLSLPLVLAGYSFLRNDEMEPYRGRELWIRAAICALVFAGLWGAFALLRVYGVIPEQQNAQVWMFAGPAFVAAGGAVGYLALDLEFGSAALLYGLYFGVTVLLRVIMGLNPL